MKSFLSIFGIKIPLEVPDKRKRTYKKRGKSKAPASPQKDKMMRVDRTK